MEIRKLYQQGKSVVIVIPHNYLKALGWAAQTQIQLSLMPDKTIKLSSMIQQFTISQAERVE